MVHLILRGKRFVISWMREKILFFLNMLRVAWLEDNFFLIFLHPSPQKLKITWWYHVHCKVCTTLVSLLLGITIESMCLWSASCEEGVTAHMIPCNCTDLNCSLFHTLTIQIQFKYLIKISPFVYKCTKT